jgi:hypothetical protein
MFIIRPDLQWHSKWLDQRSVTQVAGTPYFIGPVFLCFCKVHRKENIALIYDMNVYKKMYTTYNLAVVLILMWKRSCGFYLTEDQNFCNSLACKKMNRSINKDIHSTSITHNHANTYSVIYLILSLTWTTMYTTFSIGKW